MDDFIISGSDVWNKWINIMIKSIDIL